MNGLIKNFIRKTFSAIDVVDWQLIGGKHYYSSSVNQKASSSDENYEVQDTNLPAYSRHQKVEVLSGFMGLGMVTAKEVSMAVKQAEKERLKVSDADDDSGTQQKN